MCECCEEIEFWKKEKKEELKRGIAESKLFSQIVIYTWRKGERKIKGNQSGTIDSKAYDLNYCPMCREKAVI